MQSIFGIAQGNPPEGVREVNRGQTPSLRSFRCAVNAVVVLRCSIRGKVPQSFWRQGVGQRHAAGGYSRSWGK